MLLIILCLTQTRYMHFNYSRCKNSLKANSGIYCIFNLVKKLLIQGMQWLCLPALCCYRKKSSSLSFVHFSWFKDIKPHSYCQKMNARFALGQSSAAQKTFPTFLHCKSYPRRLYFPSKVWPAGYKKPLTWCQSWLEKLCSSLWSYLISSFLMFMWGISFQDLKCLCFLSCPLFTSAELYLAYICLIVWKLLLKTATSCCLTICMMTC